MSELHDELRAAPLYPESAPGGLDRRDFLLTLGGLAVVCLVGGAAAQEGRPRRGGGAPDPTREQLSSWLHLSEDGAITVYTGKVELGQGIRTTLAQVVGEELCVPHTAVTMVMGDTDRVPFDAGTFGSQTTPQMAPVLRRAAAAMREQLLDLAAARWLIARAGLRVAGGQVTAPDGRRMTYGELVRGQALVRTITDAPTTPATAWRIAGRSVPKVTGPEIVTGRHRYPSDIVRPGLLHGKVLRPPAFGAHLTSLDVRPPDGVTLVHDGDFVAVAAANEDLAERAIEGLKPVWRTPPQPSEADLTRLLRGPATSRLADPASPVAAGLVAAEVKLEQTYTVAYIAHTPLEPRAAVAEWADGRLTVWTGTQRPFGVRQELARAFSLPEDRVHVLMPDVGSGYGGKHTADAAVEAARLSKAAGRPVKVTWTREEELTWAYFRPAGVIEVVGGVKRDGTLTAWEHHNYHSGPAGLDTLYEVAHKKVEFHRVDGPLRTGSYRGLAGTANFFARESFMDELAHAVGQDPLEFRLHNLRNERLTAVFRAAADRFGWSGNPNAGLAGGFEKGGYVATCAEVTIGPGGKIQVVRLVTAFECGALINPDAVKNQVEGATVMALGGALSEAIHFGDGKILNASLSRYRVPRFSDLPPIEVVLLDRKDLPSSGAGETPMMAVAPAIGNAWFRSTGERRRALPMVGARPSDG